MKLTGVPGQTAFVDPAFTNVINRFFSVISEYDAKLTIFIVGKDLENKEAFRQVRKWSEMGHEIGNHSYDHHQNFGQLGHNKIYEEVKKSHDIIAECIGENPKGFIAPAWSFCPELPDILAALGYKYDTSLFPSFLMPAILLMLRSKSNVDKRTMPILRKDLLGSVFGSTEPYYVSSKHPWRNRKRDGNLVMLPLPVTRFRIPIWHSLCLRLSFDWFEKLLINAIDRVDSFYYLMHPADLVDPKFDLKTLPRTVRTVERIDLSIEQKIKCLQKSIAAIAKKCSFVTMSELAKDAKRRLKVEL